MKHLVWQPVPGISLSSVQCLLGHHLTQIYLNSDIHIVPQFLYEVHQNLHELHLYTNNLH